MQFSGSSGLGAVSSGVVELIIEGAIALVVLLVLFGLLKLAKTVLVRATLLGLFGAVLLSAAVLAVEMVYANRVIAQQMADCEARAAAGGGGGMCFGSAQFGGYILPVAFVLGFAVAFIWFMRRQRRPVA